MTNAHFNYTDKLFNFNVSGSTGECDGNFRVTWDGGAQQGPYNFSVIPLDRSYQPFIVPVDSSLQYYDWKVNMSAGTYFTVMFKWVQYEYSTCLFLLPLDVCAGQSKR